MRLSTRVLFVAALSALAVVAQSDPPGRVGRLSYVSGEVSFRPGDVEDWVPAQINRPLTTGDHIWVDEGARAELHIGTAALRLNSRTAFEFLNLDDSTAQIRLTEGSLNIRLRALSDSETFEVDTPNLAFSLLRTGEYRIDVNPDTASTVVTVRGGEGEVTGNNQAFPVRPGEQARAVGTDSPSFDTLGSPGRDEWDDWCSARDRRDDQSQSARYVSREMVGYQDLDDNGDWRTVPDYGPVWVPRGVVVGWAPYRYGHWVWVEPWGWTWVDDAPWGFAPFHYGRWIYAGYWAWVPGPVAVRPVYAPALVAWVGGPRFSLSVSFGAGVAGVAWFPLGPREVYVPAYRASPAYVNRVNVTNTTIVNNINITNINTTNVRYVNREVPGAVTAVPQNALATARPVQSAAVPVSANAVRAAEITNTAPVAPTRQSVLGGVAARGRVAQPPAAVQNRAVVARVAPPPAPVPFAQRQQALAANPGRPLDSAQVETLRVNEPAGTRPYVRPAQGSFSTGRGAAARPQFTEPPQNQPAGPRSYRPNAPAASQPESRPGRGGAPQPNVAPNNPAPRVERPETAQPRPRSERPAVQPPARQPEPQDRQQGRGERRKEPPKNEDRKEERDRR
ncbi:MAG TPA: DUF6600 domain-containing protein [Bryobacteraceae bacterium]|nr:DUF6600 domain-containing protein [Bryobacteraceae bacterium]